MRLSFTVVERYCAAKSGDASENEDMIVATPDYVAVLDGTTDKSNASVGGMSPGRFAAVSVATILETLEPRLSAREAIDAMTTGLRDDLLRVGYDPGVGEAAVVAVIYSAHRHEIWRVGDCTYTIDGVVRDLEEVLEHHAAAVRAAFIHASLLKGASVSELCDVDSGRAFILPLLQLQPMLRNVDTDLRYAYGAIDGRHVPDRFLEVESVPPYCREIVLATDGYPEVMGTLEASEAHLAYMLSEDPLCINVHPQTKGKTRGLLSFDDRSYVRLAFYGRSAPGIRAADGGGR